MHFIIKLTVICLAALIISPLAKAQEVYRLDLETSILLARQKSIRMQMLNQQLQTASFNLKATTSRLKTHASLDMTLPQYTETVKQWEDSTGISFYPVRQNQLNGYLTISQPLPTDGSLYIRTGAQNFVDYYAMDRNTQISSSIGLRQPIEAFFGYNTIRMSFKQAKLAYELSMKQLKREELNMVYEVSQDYFNLLSYQEQMNIARLSLERQQEAADIAQSKFKAGLIREVEALQMDVDLSASVNTYDMAKVDYAAQVRQFKENLGISLRDSVIINGELTYKVVPVDMEKAVALALQSRPELRENEIQIELQEMVIKQQRAQGLPSGTILLNYNFIGVGKDARSIPVGATFDQTWQNLTSRPGSLGIGLTASIPIVDWGENHARVQAARSILKQNELQLEGNRISIERDIRSTVDRLQSSLRRLQLLEKNVIVAEKSFDISRQRYANGEIDSQSMALERERLNNAYNTRLSAYITYKLMLSDIMRKTFFDFEKGVAVL
ncbi:MAG: TolC family protein [Bacteroidales bacterium]|jgi:outer membrane protein TolC